MEAAEVTNVSRKRVKTIKLKKRRTYKNGRVEGLTGETRKNGRIKSW